MDVILKKDVSGLGKAGDLVRVKDGYARNFLFPKGLAVEATKGSITAQQHLKSAQQEKADRLLTEARQQAQRLEGARLIFSARAGQGRIFGSITAQEIADKIKSMYKIEIDKRKVLLEENLKDLGEHEVFVQLHPSVRARVIVEIRAEVQN